jgi:hypothetical protein
MVPYRAGMVSATTLGEPLPKSRHVAKRVRIINTLDMDYMVY